MRKLIVFNLVSLDGYIADGHGDMSWAHGDPEDVEWSSFIADNARGGGGLIFGRKTYELMANFWPTPQAKQSFPEVAKRMNRVPKLVFSRTLRRSTWKNTKICKGDLVVEIQAWKRKAGSDLAILGSGNLVAQAAQAGLVDEFQVVVVPIALGEGKTMFANISERLPLQLTKTRVFGNGNVLLCYRPVVRAGAESMPPTRMRPRAGRVTRSPAK
jgi:dihydrofolate reductase